MGRAVGLGISLLVLATPPVSAQLPPSGFEAGKPFPEIVLPSADDGRPLSIGDFRGTRVVLHVFASW